MAAVTNCSDFRAQENKIFHCFHFFPFYLPWRDVTACHNLSFLNVEFQASFSFSSSTLIKSLFSSSSLSSIRVILSACLSLLLFPSAILIFTCDSSSLAFHIMSSAYKLNMQDGNVQPCCTPFSCSMCRSVASSPAHRFLRGQIRWSGITISLRIFQLVVIHTVKGISLVNEAEVDIFLEFPLFLHDPLNVSN